MDWKFALEIVAGIIGLVGMLILFLRRMDAQFAKATASQLEHFNVIRAENRESFHQLDMKVHGVEVTVGPYAQDIVQLKRNQNDNMVKLTELASTVENLKNGQVRLERQLENVQNRNR